MGAMGITMAIIAQVMLLVALVCFAAREYEVPRRKHARSSLPLNSPSRTPDTPPCNTATSPPAKKPTYSPSISLEVTAPAAASASEHPAPQDTARGLNLREFVPGTQSHPRQANAHFSSHLETQGKQNSAANTVRLDQVPRKTEDASKALIDD